MDEAVSEILKMAEHFRLAGDVERYMVARHVATRLLDYLMYIKTYQPNSEACRKQKSQGQSHGTCARVVW